jgi:hypothetical protein
MKVAHLILAHKNPAQLLRLIEALQHPGFHFFIHVDQKIAITPFTALIARDDVTFITKRTKIYWGDWGTIQATLNGFEAIIPKGYDYINVISGQDFPIKSAEYIYHYFEAQKGTEFITCDFIEGDWADVASRIEEYHLINWRVPGKFRLSKLITRILPERVFPFPGYKIVGRANWFSLTGDAARYAVDFLKKHPRMARYFKYCWGADEFIFSTILYNSHFKGRIKNNLVYVDWSGTEVGHPRLLDARDMDKLKASDKLFARKFDQDVEPTIFSMLEELTRN